MDPIQDASEDEGVGEESETCLRVPGVEEDIEKKIKVELCLIVNAQPSDTPSAAGWETIAKAIEHEVNSVPLGFLYHQGTANPLLCVLCPNLLKNSTFTDRAPKGLFSIPDSAEDMMTNIGNTYNM